MDQLDSKIKRILREERRRSESRRIVTEAISLHQRTVAQGGTLLEANSRLLSTLGQGVLLMEAVAKEEGEDEGIFRKSMRVLIDSLVESLADPVIGRVLSTLGVEAGTQAYGALKRVIKNVFSGLAHEVVSGKRSISDLWDCEVLSRSFAVGCAESLPEAIFDTFVGIRPGESPSGLMITVREAIANYFADSKTVQKIADGFKDALCDTDFVAHMRAGARNLQLAGIGATAFA